MVLFYQKLLFLILYLNFVLFQKYVFLFKLFPVFLSFFFLNKIQLFLVLNIQFAKFNYLKKNIINNSS